MSGVALPCGVCLDLLPFLYALLAALTGINAGDGSAAAVRAPVSAMPVSACASAEGVKACAATVATVRRIAERPSVAIAKRFVPDRSLARMAPVLRLRIVSLAGFANRRE